MERQRERDLERQKERDLERFREKEQERQREKEREEVRLRERNYDNKEDDFRRNNGRDYLRTGNDERDGGNNRETKILRETSIPVYQNREARIESDERVEDLISDDFTVEDLDFLRVLSKDELIKRLIKALRMYRNERSRRMWIESELRRILGVSELPENLDGVFGEHEISSIKKKPVRERLDSDASVYGGLSQYTASPRRVPVKEERPNRSLNIIVDEAPVTLESQYKSYRNE